MDIMDIQSEFEDLTSSTVDDVTPYQQVAVNQLMEIIGSDDEQGKLLVEMMAQASHYGSSTMRERIKMRVRAIKLAGKLIQEIRKELSGYRRLNVQLTTLTNDFVSYVRDIQREANKVLGILDLKSAQLEGIIDELTQEQHPLAESTDEINRCVDTIFSIISPATTSCDEIVTKLSKLQEKVLKYHAEEIEPAREKTIQREKNSVVLKRGLTITGVGAAGGLATGSFVVGAPVLGGVGVVVIAGVAVSPVGVIILSIAGGAAIIGGIGFLVSRVLRDYGKFRTRAVQYLEWLSKLSTYLLQDIENMKQLSHTTNIHSDRLQSQLQAVKISLSSEKQRKKNAAICLRTKKSLEDFYYSLQDIVKIDLTQWTDTRRLPNENLLSIPSSTRR